MPRHMENRRTREYPAATSIKGDCMWLFCTAMYSISPGESGDKLTFPSLERPASVFLVLSPHTRLLAKMLLRGYRIWLYPRFKQVCVHEPEGEEEFSLPYLVSSSFPGHFRGIPHGSFPNTLPTFSAYAQKTHIKTVGTTVTTVM